MTYHDKIEAGGPPPLDPDLAEVPSDDDGDSVDADDRACAERVDRPVGGAP